jgi:hypothetical protein
MNFYIASGLKNAARVRQASEILMQKGHLRLYDWTAHGDVRSCGQERMREVSVNEARAVMECELMLVLLPGGAGTHTELGLALASHSNKRILLWSETGEEFDFCDNTCVFYFHPAAERIQCSFSDLLTLLSEIV